MVRNWKGEHTERASFQTVVSMTKTKWKEAKKI